MAGSWRTSKLWGETCAIPTSLRATLTYEIEPVVSRLRHPEVRRVVATGNGAAYYAALSLWLGSLQSDSGPEIVCVPSGLVARGRFRWRTGDLMLAFSSSGELRDVIEALDATPEVPSCAITATPDSSIGTRVGALAQVGISSQEAVTHTQGFAGNVLVGLRIWAEVVGDSALAAAVADAPGAVATACEQATQWVEELGAAATPAAGVVFGSGPAWAAALEGALLLKEVAGVPSEGVETREGATSAMYALGPEALVVSLPVGDDPLVREAEAICAARGARVLAAPGGDLADARLAPITTFPALVALAAHIGVERGLDIDQPAWTDAYYAVARGTA